MKITIRREEEDDFAAVYAIYTGSSVYAGTLQLPYPSKTMWKQRLANQSNDRIGLLACVGEDVVGHLGLHTSTRPRRKHVAGLGMGVHESWQGKGVGSALMGAAVEMADNWLNIIRLELQVYTDNVAAIALYEKYGFVKEGTHIKYAFRNGVYIDAFAMARLRD